MSNEKLFLEKNIIIATEDERLTDVDRKALKAMGYERDVEIYTSGIELALFLVDIDISYLQRDNIILCYPNLTDMIAEEFIRLMSLHPLVVNQPIVGVATSASDTARFQDKGFTSIIERPLSYKQIEDTMEYATHFEAVRREELAKAIYSSDFNISSKDFFARLNELQNAIFKPLSSLENLSPAQALYYGYDLLRDKEINRAIPALLKALSDVSTQPEASLALAQAYATNQQHGLVRKYLAEAIQAYAFTDNHEKMLDLTSKYKKKYVNATHPLIPDTQRYIDNNRITDFMLKLQVLDHYYAIEEESNALAQKCLENNNAAEIAKEMMKALDQEKQWIGKVIIATVDRGLAHKPAQAQGAADTVKKLNRQA